MRNIAEMTTIQIDVTNVCDRSCSNCTRFCGHFPKEKIYFMSVEHYEAAVKSLVGYEGRIGMIGGEPTLHPDFPQLCEILKKYIPNREQRGLWSNTSGKFDDYKDIIDDTFGFMNLNDHVSNPILHTPILVASEDFINDKALSEDEWRDLTNKCWVQMNWSATITPKGAYFCEVAGMLDYLFEGNIAWDITTCPDWWKKKVDEYALQIEWACRKCGCQLPLKPRRSTDKFDDVSVSNLERLKSVNSPKICNGLYQLYDAGLDYSQIRDNTWYWNKVSQNGFFKKLINFIKAKIS